MQEPDPIGHIYSALKTNAPYFELVEHFYKGVETDSLLRPLYPQDLTQPKEHLALFLVQRTGGPSTYSDERGHPRMRARHMPFRIGIPERDAWLKNMKQALDMVPEFAAHKQALYTFFETFATFLINHSE
jgi:hemoglobin